MKISSMGWNRWTNDGRQTENPSWAKWLTHLALTYCLPAHSGQRQNGPQLQGGDDADHDVVHHGAACCDAHNNVSGLNHQARNQGDQQPLRFVVNDRNQQRSDTAQHPHACAGKAELRRVVRDECAWKGQAWVEGVNIGKKQACADQYPCENFDGLWNTHGDCRSLIAQFFSFGVGVFRGLSGLGQGRGPTLNCFN